MDYFLIRSNRKTAAIHIQPDGRVEVRAPLKMPQRDIDRFLDEKSGWISKKLAIVNQRAVTRGSFRLDYGSRVLYRGQEYPIVAKPGNRVGFTGGEFYFPPDIDEDGIRGNLIWIYKMLAKPLLTEKVSRYAGLMGARPAGMSISSAKKRWGSCSSKGRLNFSWMLVMADDEAIDYVVVHELAHLFEMNHSERFWQIIGEIMPDYRTKKTRLDALQKRMSGENWGW
ncbi:MAG: M48 family metallopeptidase [Oscillospiraceae bacterium]|nr:M48 family metallopeptidase [Oscillospiraceae bacterium]